MRATQDERTAFGQQLERALEATGMSQARLRELLEDEQRIEVSRTAVSNWVRGRFAPDRRTTRALDDVLDTGGQLSAALGYSADPSSPLGPLPPHLQEWLESLDNSGRTKAAILIEYVSAFAAKMAAEELLTAFGMGSMLDPEDRAAADARLDAMPVLSGLARGARVALPEGPEFEILSEASHASGKITPIEKRRADAGARASAAKRSRKRAPEDELATAARTGADSTPATKRKRPSRVREGQDEP